MGQQSKYLLWCYRTYTAVQAEVDSDGTRPTLAMICNVCDRFQVVLCVTERHLFPVHDLGLGVSWVVMEIMSARPVHGGDHYVKLAHDQDCYVELAYDRISGTDL